ncbi:hypothetical protein LTR37_016678 [Vermiconidia calcicola]|uniref:Uncharacterized protein n=1 Tax=Vermiconidia calcicola TaxID=1690605 RepID=A0ACC3MM89_9PEZI|nr:hypothetical protein LTR37_016678 [Vermiconidia calcicola]
MAPHGSAEAGSGIDSLVLSPQSNIKADDETLATESPGLATSYEQATCVDIPSSNSTSSEASNTPTTSGHRNSCMDSPVDPEPDEKAAMQYKERASTGPADYQICRMRTFDPQPLEWRPTLLRIAPLIIVWYAILKASDGDAVVNRKYQPTVYLAILTAISNKALSFAVVQGTVISWWLKAISGTTLQQMHWDWGNGLFLYKAVASGRHFNALALACLCGTLVAVDGPLLQRAVSVKSKVTPNPVSLGVSITPEIPSYFSGWRMQDAFDYTSNFLPIVDE